MKESITRRRKAAAPDASRVAIANRIRTARRRAGLSQERLALKVGVRRAAVTQWEHPLGTLPTTTNLLQVAVELGVSWEWLATGRGSMRLPVDLRDQQDAGELIVQSQELRILAMLRRASARQRGIVEQVLACML